MRILLALLLLSACGKAADPLAFRVDVPLEALDQSVILAVEVNDASRSEMSLFASSISADRTIEPVGLDFELDGTVSITALLYEALLDDLEIGPGKLMPEPNPDAQRELPGADRIQRLTIESGEASEWVDASALPEALSTFRITEPSTCGRGLTADVIRIANAARPSFAMALDDRWVLVGTFATPYLVDAAGTVVPLDGMPSAFFDGFMQDDGTIWLGGQQGAVFRGTFDAAAMTLDVTEASRLTTPEDVISIDGAASGGELFALTSNREDDEWGAFEWFDGNQWRSIGLRRHAPNNATWVEPGYGLFTSHWRDTQVYGGRDGAEVDTHVTSVIFGSVRVIRRLGDYGIVAGTSGGGVHRLTDELGAVWTKIASPLTENIGDIRRYRDSIAFTSGNSLYRYDTESLDEPGCLLAAHQGDAFVGSIAVVGEDVVIPLFDANRDPATLEDQEVVWFSSR